MAVLFIAAAALSMLVVVSGGPTQPPFDCSQMPWVGHQYNKQANKCELKTTYGGCTPPEGFMNTCEDCQQKITEGKADKKCTGLKILINPVTKSAPCEPVARWQWQTFTGKCSKVPYGCLADPSSVGFDSEEACREACEDIPLCGVSAEERQN